MLREAQELQDDAVFQLCRVVEAKNDVTFRAPTGSGKTYMMADFMNRILSSEENVIFIVSSLSKGDLARQNYQKFAEYKDKGKFPKLSPYLVNTDVSGEEKPFIPSNYNVYVLPRDLYKKGGILMRGVMSQFLQTIRFEDSGYGVKNHIYLIKDECHIETNNLDNLTSTYFDKVINMSATPKLSRGQIPDVEISDKEAVRCALIKDVEVGLEGEDLESVLEKFKEIKKQYIDLLNVKPCLIIQVSNKDKAQEEWDSIIMPALNKVENQDLRWMYIVDKDKDCRTNDSAGKALPVSRWKDYAKDDWGVDIIVFKLAISEGWDIPRACMLYQIRSTQSKQLDEQVLGRVRRNPRLMDYERLPLDAQKLARTAWVWGILPDSLHKGYLVQRTLRKDEAAAELALKTVVLKPLTRRHDFVLEDLLSEGAGDGAGKSIFQLYNSLSKTEDDLKSLCYEYSGNDVEKWHKFVKHLDKIQRKYNEFVCDYEESLEVRKNEEGIEELVTLPDESVIYSKEYPESFRRKWLWKRKDGARVFNFDSDAERQWAKFLYELCAENVVKPYSSDEAEIYLWGKNLVLDSQIRYAYYSGGQHFSYPDFILKDNFERIHLFEVKSLNQSGSFSIDSESYKAKIESLEKCYLHCSKLTGYIFHLPVLKEDVWHIVSFVNGDRKEFDEDGLFDFMSNETEAVDISV